MEKSEIYYFHSKKNDAEVVFCKNSLHSYPEHNHVSVYTLGLVLEGAIELNRKKQTITCKAGECFIIPPYEPHAIGAKYKGYTLLTACIKKEFFNGYDLDRLSETLLELLDEPVQKHLISMDQISMLLDAIDLIFVSVTGCSPLINETIASAKNILEKAPEERLQIEQLSKQVFVSKYHLIRVFKEQVGLTPHQFQMQNRIRKAQRLLKEGLPMTEAAFAAGFYDQSHFIKWFKRIVALTPTEYLAACDKMPDSVDH